MPKTSKNVIEQARFIFNSGKLIRDRIMRIHANPRTAGLKNTGYIDMSMAQLHAVKATHDRGQVTISELAELLNVSPPSVSVMVERLVDKGILIREPSREDRRKVHVRVSAQALKTIDKLEGEILEAFIDLVEKIGPETTRKWCEVLVEIKKALEKP